LLLGIPSYIVDASALGLTGRVECNFVCADAPDAADVGSYSGDLYGMAAADIIDPLEQCPQFANVDFPIGVS